MFQTPFPSTPQVWLLLLTITRPVAKFGLAITRLLAVPGLAVSKNGRARVGMLAGAEAMSVMFVLCSSKNPEPSNPNRRSQSPKNPEVIRNPLSGLYDRSSWPAMTRVLGRPSSPASLGALVVTRGNRIGWALAK